MNSGVGIAHVQCTSKRMFFAFLRLFVEILLNLCLSFVWWLTCEERFVPNCPSWIALYQCK